MKHLRALLFAAIALTAVGAQAEPRPVNILNFFVDWQDYIGKRVMVTGGVIIGASPETALLVSGRGRVFLDAPFRDREDVRYLLRNCATIQQTNACYLTVSGIVQPAIEGGSQLTDVEVYI